MAYSDSLCRRGKRLFGYHFSSPRLRGKTHSFGMLFCHKLRFFRSASSLTDEQCPNFWYLPLLLPEYTVTDQVSLLFYYLSHSSYVWRPPVRDFLVQGLYEQTRERISNAFALRNPLSYLYFAKDRIYNGRVSDHQQLGIQINDLSEVPHTE